jgi:hypothetical protein
MKRFSAILATLAIALGALGAQTVSVQVLEEGLAGASPQVLAEALVSGGMDAFFMAGIVGTSSKPTCGPASGFASWDSVDVQNLKDSYVTHVLRIFYVPAKVKKGLVPYPISLSFLLRKVDSGEIILKGDLPGLQPGVAEAQGLGAVLSLCREAGDAIARKCLGVEW